MDRQVPDRGGSWAEAARALARAEGFDGAAVLGGLVYALWTQWSDVADVEFTPERTLRFVPRLATSPVELVVRVERATVLIDFEPPGLGDAQEADVDRAVPAVCAALALLAPERKPCVRCGREVEAGVADYETFEHMHYLCFHLEFEHEGDPDVACGPLPCPIG